MMSVTVLSRRGFLRADVSEFKIVDLNPWLCCVTDQPHRWELDPMSTQVVQSEMFSIELIGCVPKSPRSGRMMIGNLYSYATLVSADDDIAPVLALGYQLRVQD